jgi:hypothetical protein
VDSSAEAAAAADQWREAPPMSEKSLELHNAAQEKIKTPHLTKGVVHHSMSSSQNPNAMSNGLIAAVGGGGGGENIQKSGDKREFNKSIQPHKKRENYGDANREVEAHPSAAPTGKIAALPKKAPRIPNVDMNRVHQMTRPVRGKKIHSYFNSKLIVFA